MHTAAPEFGSTSFSGALPQTISEQIQDCRILVVDDERSNRILIGAFLEAAGFHNVHFAADGGKALELFANEGADLMLLDIGMPDIDGFEVCRRVMQSATTQTKPKVLMQTAFTGVKERVRSFEAGASDFVTKPLMGAELVARVRMHLENHLLVRNLQDYRARIEAELDLARWMQSLLFPSRRVLDQVESETGVSIASRSATSSELGGDFWTVGRSRAADSTVASLFLCDFSGHGVSAALNAFRLHTLIEASHDQPANPADRLTLLNEQIRSVLPLGQFATVFHALVVPANDQLLFASAAAPRQILLDPKAASATLLTAPGVPLGVTGEPGFTNQRAALPKGSGLFLYSDALIESPDEEGRTLDEEQLCALLVEALSYETPEQVLDHVMARFYTGRADPLPDDLTAVVALRQ